MCSPHIHTITIWGDGYVNRLNCGNYFKMYKNIKTLHCTFQNTHSFVSQLYLNKSGKKCGKARRKCQSDVVGDRSYCPLLASKMKGRRKTGNVGSLQKWKIPRWIPLQSLCRECCSDNTLISAQRDQFWTSDHQN